MRILKGIAASSGIGIGKAFLYLHEKLTVPHHSIPKAAIPSEQERFNHALCAVVHELNEFMHPAHSDDQEKILESHKLMLTDPEFSSSITAVIAEEQKCAEWAVESVVAHLVSMLENSSDHTLRERSADLYDIGWRVIRSMMGKQRHDFSEIPNGRVLVSDNLLPSEALALNPAKIRAIALDGGGRTSHVAILARALLIPTVVGLGNVTKKVRSADDIIVDGNTGEVIIRPSSVTVGNMQKRHAVWVEHERKLEELASLDAVTTDGHQVSLMANVETLEELDLVAQHGANGIGLFRSEFLFLKPGGASEEEQFAAYKQVLEQMRDKGTVTIRTIDVGGDKIIPEMAEFDEKNPILGWRAVRFCLSRKDIFRTQLRALLRASLYGKLKIMFPMISGPEELEDVLAVFEQVKEECRKEDIRFDENIAIGTMIEVPSAALCADLLGEKADFFSIGTNDLIQYTIAVDRGNEKIAYLYQPFHVGVIRLLRMIIEKGHEAGIPVAMCGEMAGDPLSTVLLLGMGIDELSMSPQSLLQIKYIIRSVSLSQARELADTVMAMNSYAAINGYIRKWMHDRFGNFITA